MAEDKPQGSLDEIKASIGDLSGVKVFGVQVLVGMWMRPEKTKGGILLTQKTRDEDKYQGKVGFVLKKGVNAFVDGGNHVFNGDNVEVGECVLYRTSDGFPLDINGVHCRLIEDVHVKAVVSDPTMIW
jgi:co-chaperonin GroES (HSP10)